MISDVTLDYYETASLLDNLFPWECWHSNLEDIIKGDLNGLPKIRFTVSPDGPVFHLANIASFVLKFTRMESWPAVDLIEYMLEDVVREKQIKNGLAIDEELDALLSELTSGKAA